MKVYHLSHKKNRESIQKAGLIALSKPCGRITHGPRVFVSISMKTLAFDYVGYEDVDVWSFNVDEKELSSDEFSSQEGHFFIQNHVKKHLIKLEKTF